MEKEKRIWREPAYSRIFLEMMYGMQSLRGEQKGGNAGYMVWEADEPNLTAQERRPWSPPPGPRPGGPGNPWTAAPAARPRPGEPGNPWDRRPRRRDRAREESEIRGESPPPPPGPRQED